MAETAKILVVDDDADIRFTLQEICRFAGWQVVVASNGNQGLEMFHAEIPDLVIVDYHMPEMDGLALVRKIREQDVAIPIVVLTVDERQSLADGFLAAGANDFALKPIKAPDLISRIKVNLKISRLQRALARNHQEVYVVKGISNATLKVINDFLAEHPGPLSIEEITAGVNLAYQTVHRYLNHLVEEGRVQMECDYGRVGRPKHRYFLS
ncbi:response regulator [Clostridiales bacterium PH28_bin88]|nr:response regulator [Clostridiales bacterium PH28_bin88]